jgi:toxin ParE1/3/4
VSARVRQSLRAELDLLEIYEDIYLDRPDAAERFLSAARAAFTNLAEMPGMGRIWESPFRHPEGTRVLPMHGFRNYLIFYRASAGGVEILRVLHGARDLGPLLNSAFTEGLEIHDAEPE